MVEIKEVEVKVELTEKQSTDLQEDLDGRSTVEEMTEKDIYYTAPVRDFLETNECLRIRSRDGEPVELTYKGKTTPEMREQNQFWKEELDIPIESVADAKNLLKAIGCEELSTVVKHRTKAKIGEKKVTLDNVEGIDYYLEIESEVPQDQVEAARESNRQLLRELGIDQPDLVEEPYRDLVLESSAQATPAE